MIITIDGPAGSGKSTVAQLVAQEIGADFLDTGAMYRAVVLAAMQADKDLNDEARILQVLENTSFIFDLKNGKTQVLIDNRNCTDAIRDPKVTANVCYAASVSKVRQKLVQMQRDFAVGKEKIVTEGRDQGTVAFPDAEYKFFLTASECERAKRRFAELKAVDPSADYDQVLEAIKLRDHSDINRQTGPLKPAGDAININTTDLNIEQVVEKILSYIK